MGYMWSPVTEFTFIIKHIEWIPAYALHLIGFQLFCMTLALLIKRSGITIAGLIFYVFIIENICYAILTYDIEWPTAARFLPVKAIGNIIPLPFSKYAMMETQTTIGMGDLAILCGYIVLLYGICYQLMVKKDLR